MNYEQLYAAVMDAYRQEDLTQVLGIMDRFIETAHGAELGHALCLKASFLMYHDHRRSGEGLGLVEEALAVAEGDPGLQMKCVVDGLGLCYTMGDPHRAKRYDLLGHQVLKEHAAVPEVQKMTHRMYLNLAHIATLRQELTQAYWHLVQGTQALLALPEESPDVKLFRFLCYLQTSEICMDMGRGPEAEDALVKAKEYILSDADELQWSVFKASYLESIHDHDSAAELLDGLAERVATDRRPSIQVLFHLSRSLVAQARGEVQIFHYHLSKAQDTAITYTLDYMLCRIQRVMRTPVRLEAAK